MSVLDRPTAEQALARIACLFLQILRMELELEFQEVAGTKEKAELREELEEFRESLQEDPFIAGATTEENRRIRADFGGWTEDDFIVSSFGMDALPPLLFAVQLIDELPPHEESIEEFDEALSDFESMIGKAKFRSWDEIEAARDEVEALVTAMPDEPETEEEEFKLAVLEARLAGLEWLAGEFTDWEEA